MLVIRAGTNKILSEKKTGKTLKRLRSSLVWVCPVSLGFCGRQLLFKILEHLPYVQCCYWICVDFTHVVKHICTCTTQVIQLSSTKRREKVKIGQKRSNPPWPELYIN